MVIEDDKATRGILKLALENANYEVAVAADGNEALTILSSKENHPELILLDLAMPGMNGFEFREAQLKSKDLAHIPAILLTANNSFIKYKEPLQAFEFLNKPIELKDLLFIIENFFILNSKSSISS